MGGRHRARRTWPVRPVLTAAAVSAASLTVVVALTAGPAPPPERPLPDPPFTASPQPGPVVPTPTAEAAAVAAAALSAAGRVQKKAQERDRAERERERQTRIERERQREERERREREQVERETAERVKAAEPAPEPPSAPVKPPPPPPAPAKREDPPLAECPTGLAGTVAHVSRAGHHIAGHIGVPLDSILGRGPRGSATSDHPTGHALDYMVDRATGDRLAAYVLEHRVELGVKYVIWRQRYNDGSGWSRMEDRGSDTANHMDHVHVSFNDDAGSGLPC